MPRVIARVNNPKNHWMFTENWGVDVAVSTPHLLTSLVEEAVSVGTLVRLLSFERGRASLIEVTLANDAKVANREIVDLDFPATPRSWRCSARSASSSREATRCSSPVTRCWCWSPPTARPTSKPSSPNGDVP